MATIHRSRLNAIPDPDNSINIVTVRLNPDRVLVSETPIKCPEDAVKVLREEMQDMDREHFVVLNLDSKGRTINAHIASIGSIGEAPVHPREVFKTAILSNAASVLVMHNHPSGEADPSEQDFDVTKRLVASGQLMGIKVLDHIVVGRDKYYSFKESGDLSSIEYEAQSRFTIVRESEEEYLASDNKKLSFREKVAQTFIKSLEESPRDWVKKWASNETERAYNMASGRPYRGGNAFFLKFIEKAEGYQDPRWLTFRQAVDAGYKVPKGTMATPVEYYFMYDRLNKRTISWSDYNALSEDEKNQRVDTSSGQIVTDPDARGMTIMERFHLRAKEHYVFNAAQLEGVPEYVINRVENDISVSAVVDAVSAGMGVEIIEEEQGRAFYSPATDRITMPLKTQFASDYDYQSTALHELGHATGHPTRLDRDMQNWFGTPEYAYEELIAEVTSCFMGEYLDVPMNEQDMDNHVAYIQNWITAIEKDPNYLFKAIKEAEKAADFMAEKGELEMLRAEIMEGREADLAAERAIDMGEALYAADGVMSIGSPEEKQMWHEMAVATGVAEDAIDYASSLEENRERLSREIESVLDGTLYMRESIMLCEHTPELLQRIGLEDKPILFTQKHLRDGLHEKGKNPKWHGLHIDDYLNLEQNMNDPAFIIDSFSDDDSVLVVTSTVDDDKNPIMACIRANGEGQYRLTTIGSNYLTSVYGRENFINFLEKNLDADFVLYAGKEKTQELERISELPLFRDYSSHLEFDKIIHKSNNIVNESESINDTVADWYREAYPTDDLGGELFEDYRRHFGVNNPGGREGYTLDEIYERADGEYRYKDAVSGKWLTAEQKEAADLIDDAIKKIGEKADALRGKETERMAENEKNGKKLYIELNKAFCRQTEDRFVEGKMFNIMTMPKGTTLNGKDVGGCTISPLYMDKSRYNQNNMVATYYLKENEPTMIKLTAKDGSYEKVDVEKLKESIDAQQKLYREQQQERAKEKEQAKTVSKKQEKDRGDELE